MKTQYVWQTLGLLPDAWGYHEYSRAYLMEVFRRPPRLLLDVGCAAGAFGAQVKARYPDCRVVGVEANGAAAALARERLDQVLACRFEDCDLEQAGIAGNSIDTVVLADVLEHMYDPWQVLVGLKARLAADVQLVVSLPNVRNLLLLKELAEGRWTYQEQGLLDITHIRFFTLAEAKRMLEETGYDVEAVMYGLDPRLKDFHAAQRGKAAVDIDMGRLAFRGATPAELDELCAQQFFLRAAPRDGGL